MVNVAIVNPPSMDGYVNRDLMSGLGVKNYSKRNFMDGFISHIKSFSRRLPVMSLVYSATVLSEKHTVKVIDAGNLGMNEEQLERELGAFAPDFIVFASSISNLPDEVRLLERFKEVFGAKTVMVGDATSEFGAVIMRESKVDFVISGEPEISLARLIDGIAPGTIDGITMRTATGIFQSKQEPIDDLDSLPFPKWGLFPFKNYGYYPILKNKPFVSILSTRGCPYGCTYCPYTTFMGRQWRMRKSENVVREMQYLQENFGIKSVLFRDPTFTMLKKHAVGICEGIKQNKIYIEWGCETRLDCLDEELIDLMAGAGCVGINCGIESADPKVLSNVMRKVIPESHIRKMLHRMKDNGIKSSGFFILGLPGETAESLEKTIELALSLDLSYADFKVATPFPGTPLYDLCVKNGWIKKLESLKDLPKLTSYDFHMQYDDKRISKEFIERKCGEAFKRFYGRPGPMAMKLIGGDLINRTVFESGLVYLKSLITL